MPVSGPGVVQGPGPPFILSAGPVLLILPAILILAPQFTRGEIIRAQFYWQGKAWLMLRWGNKSGRKKGLSEFEPKIKSSLINQIIIDTERVKQPDCFVCW